MSQIDVSTARAIKNLKLTIGTDSYEKHVNEVRWSKSVNNVTWKGGTPDAVVSDMDATDHVCNITLVHDYQNEDSLFNFLIDHEGEQAEIEYKPDADGAYTQTATVTLVAPDAGGTVGQFATQTLALPSSKPVRTFSPVGE